MLASTANLDNALPFGNMLSPEPQPFAESHFITMLPFYSGLLQNSCKRFSCSLAFCLMTHQWCLLLIITWFLALSIVPLWVVGQYSSKTLDSLIGDKAVAPIFDNASTLQRLFDVVRNLLLRSTINQEQWLAVLTTSLFSNFWRDLRGGHANLVFVFSVCAEQ